ncbi:response regulator [Desulfohalovibrio reitneri]|uniref:response regulator n=1 Tax=Desulfohalovibrio reitneri TaxID=1307759 RepID=UPI0004A73EAD|nr:response regulator [Desulfohalovibrio reitneri]
MRFNVLVVEDDFVIRKFLSDMLEQTECSVHAASNADEARKWLTENGNSCDLVLMDVGLPGETGLELTKRIRNMEPPTRDLPIVAVTAYAMSGDREKCLEAEMDDYLAKPFTFDDLLGVLQRHLGDR